MWIPSAFANGTINLGPSVVFDLDLLNGFVPAPGDVFPLFENVIITGLLGFATLRRRRSRQVCPAM